jgi:polyisoprenoid-binding protein YceI
MTNPVAAAALLLMTLSAAATSAEPAPTGAAAAGGARYVQATSGNSLTFTFTQLGAATQGEFKTFATELQYDPANPSAGSLLVRVMIDSVDTQDEERDQALKDADLFDARSHPAATYVAKSFATTSAGTLEAVGRLTLRGVSRDLRLPLTLQPTANGLALSGQTSIKRLDFGVGQGDFKSTESVGDEVKIEYRVNLVRSPR